MKKIVIPQTNITATYILSELEELAREEFSRLKKIKAKKKAKKKHDHEENHVCPICNKILDNAQNKDDICSSYIVKEKEIAKPNLPLPIIRVVSPDMAPSLPVSTKQSSTDLNCRLNFIKTRLTDIITITKTFLEEGLDSCDVNEFLIICKEAEKKIEFIFEEQSPCQLDSVIRNQLANIKHNLRNVVEVTKNYKNKGFVQSSIDEFVKECEVMDSMLIQDQQQLDNKTTKSQIKELIAHIDDAMQMTQNYTSEGLLTPGAEEFLRSCSIVKAKIEGKPLSTIDENKLDHLKDHISELEKMTVGFEEKKITSASIEKFISACKEFKTKIQQDIEKLRDKKTINELSEPIDKIIGIEKEAQKEGLLGKSCPHCINSIGDVKEQIYPEEKHKSTEDFKESSVLDALKSQINSVIKSGSKIKSSNSLSLSIDNLLKTCETAKAKIDAYQKSSKPLVLEKRMIYPNCSKSCICERENLSTGEYENYQQMGNVVPYYESEPAPCNSCRDTDKEKISSAEAICETCSRTYEEDILLPEETNLTPEESEICEICEILKREKEAENEPQEPIPPAVDSSLGYFEKKIRKITRVTRTQNPDGTIREEKETITFRKEKHDPNETTLLHDDEDEEYDISYDSLDENNEKRVAVCSTPNQNQRGFFCLNNKAKSEIVFRASPMAAPMLKHCISYDSFNIQDYDYSIAKDSFSMELDFCSLYTDSRNISNE